MSHTQLFSVHVMHALAPVTVEYVPTGHKTHALALLAPATPEYAPAGQLIHAAELVSATATEYLPAEQAMHALDPVTVLYCPAGHGVHVRPAGPVYPASHTQSVIKPDMPSVFEFGGHKLQFALPSGDHCPSGQKRHVSGPVAL